MSFSTEGNIPTVRSPKRHHSSAFAPTRKPRRHSRRRRARAKCTRGRRVRQPPLWLGPARADPMHCKFPTYPGQSSEGAPQAVGPRRIYTSIPRVLNIWGGAFATNRWPAVPGRCRIRRPLGGRAPGAARRELRQPPVPPAPRAAWGAAGRARVSGAALEGFSGGMHSSRRAELAFAQCGVAMPGGRATGTRSGAPRPPHPHLFKTARARTSTTYGFLVSQGSRCAPRAPPPAPCDTPRPRSPRHVGPGGWAGRHPAARRPRLGLGLRAWILTRRFLQLSRH